MLCFYEHIITFGEEVRCVWGRRVSGASVLFLLNRYAILVVSLASIVQVLPWTMVLPKDVDLPNLSGLSVDTGTYGMVSAIYWSLQRRNADRFPSDVWIYSPTPKCPQ